MNDQPDNAPTAYRFTDPRQRRIHERLALIGPGPAGFYRDVCRLMSTGPAVEATTHLVAHLLREIESAIRDVLRRGPKPEGHRADIESILTAYGIDASDPAAIAWLRLADEGHDERLAPFAHRDALGAPRKLDEAYRQFVAEVEGIFDIVLARFEGRFLGSLPLIDSLLKKSVPSDADVKTLRGKVPNNLITHEYFFGKVEAPGWLELLAAEGFFSRPPDPVRDEEKGVTRFPPWPESRYLARMAAKPELQRRVVEIALTIPDTQNINVHEDLVRLALAVPAPLAALLMPKVRQWIESPYQLRLLHRMGDLVAHLAAGGEIDAALELAATFLTILPDPDVKERSAGEQTWRLPPHPRTAHDEWLVGEFLKDVLPSLVDVAGVRALTIVCNALSEAVRLSQSRPEEQGPQDYSSIWRPAIEDHEGNLDNELKSTLVTAVRKAAERVLELDPTRLAEVIATLEGYRWSVFSRIALHLLREAAPKLALPLVEQRLIQRDRFEGGSQKREYMLLAEKFFSQLSDKTQRTILGWIDEGPDLEPHKRFLTEFEGKSPSDEEVAESADRWRLEHLRPLRDVLPRDWRERYQRLVERYGEPEMPDFVSIRMGELTRGPESPITPTELRQTPVADVIARLKTWEPAGEFQGPSPEGLSRALATAVEEDPTRFAAEAESFKNVDPTYVRGLLTGFRDAVNKGRPFDWAPVLKLCQWVIGQPVEADDGGRPWERDRGWRWTRKAIADLLEDGLRPGPCQIPFSLREDVWKVLWPLTDDLDPSPADDATKVDPEPATTAINTTRGEAMHALVRYALWVKAQLGRGSDGGSTRKEVGFGEMTEAREVLDAHLDPVRDPSLAIRSVYGQYLPSLIYLDREWVKANLARIFPTEESLARFRDAAWDTYVVFCAVYNDAADILKQEYARAAARLGAVEKEQKSPTDPENHLAEHLMILYWRGKIELEGPELSEYYSRTSDAIRGHAMWFVGRVFGKEGDKPPSEMVDRLKRMFETRLAAARATPGAHRKELEQFGSWFASGRFGDEWSLRQLVEVLRLVGSAEPDSLVMGQLVKLAGAYPVPVLECVRLMVESADEYWKIEARRAEIREIVRIARQQDKQTREAAETLVNILAARGHLDFRDLLEG